MVDEAQIAKVKRLLVGIYILWGVYVFVAPLLGFFENDPTKGWFLTAAIFLPGVIMMLAYLSSAAFKQFILSLDTRKIIMVQYLRMGGIVFYIAYLVGAWSKLFGLSAAVLDMLWGFTAPLIVMMWAKRPFRKTIFVGWQIIGIFEIGILVAIRMLTLPGLWGDPIIPTESSAHGVYQLPWSLLPTLIAPNLIISHIICAIHGLRVEAAD